MHKYGGENAMMFTLDQNCYGLQQSTDIPPSSEDQFQPISALSIPLPIAALLYPSLVFQNVWDWKIISRFATGISCGSTRIFYAEGSLPHLFKVCKEILQGSFFPSFFFSLSRTTQKSLQIWLWWSKSNPPFFELWLLVGYDIWTWNLWHSLNMSKKVHKTLLGPYETSLGTHRQDTHTMDLDWNK